MGPLGPKMETPLFHYNVSVFFSAGIFRRESSWSLLIYSICVYYVHIHIYILYYIYIYMRVQISWSPPFQRMNTNTQMNFLAEYVLPMKFMSRNSASLQAKELAPLQQNQSLNPWCLRPWHSRDLSAYCLISLISDLDLLGVCCDKNWRWLKALLQPSELHCEVNLHDSMKGYTFASVSVCLRAVAVLS